MATEDDDRPRKKISHEIGQDLSLLSVEELTERVTLLKSEIARLEEAATRKHASRDAADSFSRSRISRSARVSRTRCSAQRCSAEPGPMHLRIPLPKNWAPAQQRTATRCAASGARERLGHWPIWLTNPQKIRSFTVD